MILLPPCVCVMGRAIRLATTGALLALVVVAGLWPTTAAAQTSTVAPPPPATNTPLPATSGPSPTTGPTEPAQPTSPPSNTPAGQKTAEPTATLDVLPDAPSKATAREVFVPVLRTTSDGTGCVPTMRVQNAGPEDAKVIAMFWDDPSNSDGPDTDCGDRCGPIGVWCSGLLSPGGTWVFDDFLVPADARSAALYSFNTKTLEDIGLNPPVPVDPNEVAEIMCETLYFAMVADCYEYRNFKREYERGGNYAGLPMDRAFGGPLAVEVVRECEHGDAVGGEGTRLASYEALPHGRLGRESASGSYDYGVPIVHASEDVVTTTLHVQNVGRECADVDVWTSPQGPCAEPELCAQLELPVGMSRSVDVTACTVDRGASAAWITGDQPLAVAADTEYDEALLSHAAIPASEGAVPLGDVQQVAVGSTTAAAPLVFSDYLSTAPERDASWSSRIHVQNLSPDQKAFVGTTFFDRSGDALMTYHEWICPRGSHTFDVRELVELPENWVGWALVASRPYQLEGEPEVAAQNVAAVVENSRFTWPQSEDERPRATEGYSYPLAGEADVFDWPHGHGEGGLQSGIGFIAIPSLAGGGVDKGPSSDLAIANVVSRPGFTDFVVFIHDQNGLLDYVCQKLNEKQTEYIDLSTWGYINPGFEGSALISAMFWEHDYYDAGGNWVRNLVGLAAVSLSRPYLGLGGPFGSPEGDDDQPGDASVGIRAPHYWLGEGAGTSYEDACPGGGPWRPTPVPSTPAPSATPTPDGSTWRVFLPYLAGSADGG